jgi:diacylglycerol O-acyltransferase / wax synthase
MTKQQFNPVDATWLHMETANSPMHVGVLATFSLPRKAGPGYLINMVQRLRASTDIVSPWNLKLAQGIGSRLVPALETDPSVDLDYHFRHSALPSPGGERELGVVVSRLHSNALDRSRPLWEIHLIEGLENNRLAIYTKVHRALLDDINAIPLVTGLLSASARQKTQAPWSTSMASRAPSTANQLLRDFRVTEVASSIGKAAAGLLKTGLSRRKSGSFLVSNSAPFSTLNRPITAQRRFATAQFEQDRVEAIAKATDSTVNEILTYLCGSSLRRFFKEYNALPEKSLVGLIPVSLQERGAHNPGGAIAGIRVELATDQGNPRKRLEAVKESIASVRDDRTTLPEDAAISYALMRSIPILMSQSRAIGQFMRPLFNVHVSVTPGPDRPLYLEGARLESIYPMTQLMQYSALSIDCVSYAGTLNIGFCGARETIPRLQRLAVYMNTALVDLEELVYPQKEAL